MALDTGVVALATVVVALDVALDTGVVALDVALDTGVVALAAGVVTGSSSSSSSSSSSGGPVWRLAYLCFLWNFLPFFLASTSSAVLSE